MQFPYQETRPVRWKASKKVVSPKAQVLKVFLGTKNQRLKSHNKN